MKVVYCAGPFRGKNSWEVEQNIRRAEELGFKVAEAGAFPIIPHTNCRFWNGTQTDQFWLDGTMAAMRKCDAVIFTPDYENSSGALLEEIDAIKRKQLRLYSIGQLKAWLLENPE